jgi:hypothetical protein
MTTSTQDEFIVRGELFASFKCAICTLELGGKCVLLRETGLSVTCETSDVEAFVVLYFENRKYITYQNSIYIFSIQIKLHFIYSLLL